MLVFVISDGVVQLVAHGDLEGRDETLKNSLSDQKPSCFPTALNTKLYRIHGWNIGDPPPLPPSQ